MGDRLGMKKAIIISCFDWYEKRIEPLVQILSPEYQVRVLLSDFDHIKKETIEKKYKSCTYIHVLPYKRNISVTRILSHIQFGQKVKGYLKEYRPDVIYVLLPPNNVAAQCLKYKQRNEKSKMVVDVIDLWPESMPLGNFNRTFLANIWRKWRDDSIKGADLVITECDLYQEKLKDVLKDKPVVTNYIFKDNTVEVLKNIKDGKFINKKVVLGYVGSINNILDIELVGKILCALKAAGIFVECKVIGDGDHREQFLRMLEGSASVEYYGQIFEEKEKYKILSECDYGLNIMKSTVSVGLSIKSVDYFSYGIPIINNVRGDTWKLVEQNGLGINVTDDLNALVEELCTKKINTQDIIDCFQSLFTRDAYISNTKQALLRCGL